jgi:CelD/BcsL family acetyltransferase involved in cellulose biosynthesis
MSSTLVSSSLVGSGQAADRAQSRIRATLAPIDATTDFTVLVAGFTHTPFQSPIWLKSWFETLGVKRHVEGFWLALENDDGPMLAMPIVRRREKGLTVLEMPDCGVTDYAAPLLGKPAFLEGLKSSELWLAMLSALPAADLLRLERCPPDVAGVANPLALHSFALPSRISGWQRELPTEWEGYFNTLSGRMREKIGKASRRFARADGAQTGRITDVAKARALLPRLSEWQAERMGEKGRDYELDDPAIAAFYERLIDGGVDNGAVMMMALEAEGSPVAMNFAYRSGPNLVYLRVGNTFGKWSPMAPGILATHAILKEAHATGVTRFDFGAGDYEYKERFGAEKRGLVDIEIPLSFKAWPHVLMRQLRRRLAQNEMLKSLVQRWRARNGQPAAPKSSEAD